MRKIAFVMILGLLLSLFAGCSITREVANLPYEIIVENGVSYLLMKESGNKVEADSINDQVWYGIYFLSVEELISDISTGNFSDEELYYLSHFPKDDAGRIQVCNMEELLVPAVPSPLALASIYWNGWGFTYMLGCEGDDTVYRMQFVSKEQHEEEIEFDANFASRTTCTVHSQSIEEDRDASVTYYTNLTEQECKGVYYTVGEGDNEIHVWENYVLIDEVYELDFIDINCSDNGVYFSYSAYESERPSVEWLSQFGIREYVKTEVA